jgi:7-cyano-7-deazaguanine synthase in queuosine biosynthesis
MGKPMRKQSEFEYRNNPSSIAYEIMRYGLEGNSSDILEVPIAYAELAQEIYNVPERPESFNPRNVIDAHRLNQIAVLVSGGLDSTVGYLMAKEALDGREPLTYYCNMGQIYAEKEKTQLAKMGIPFTELIIPQPPHIEEDRWQYIHPGRNFLYITTVAELMPNGGEIWLGAVDGEISHDRSYGGDKSDAFFSMANEILANSLPYPVKIHLPHYSSTKTDLVTWASTHGYMDIVKQTISCFNEEDGRCGKCQSCLRTYFAFAANGVEIPFNAHPMIEGRQHVEKYKRVLPECLEKQDFSHYSERRCQQDLDVINKYERGDLW